MCVEGSRPWSRVRQPMPIPQPVTVAGLLGLPEAEFVELLRGNLLPRVEQREARRVWETLWWTLSSDADLVDRAYGVLDGFLAVTEEAIRGDLVEEVEAGGLARARKFRGQCLQAWARLDRDAGTQPLAWAGSAAAGFDRAGRTVVALLVSAIATHRGSIRRERRIEDRDRRLWAALERTGLDPRSPGERSRDVAIEESSLGWAGPRAAGLSPVSRAVIAILVSAIAAHRAGTVPGAATWPDRRLWHILGVTAFDPQDY